MLVNNDFIPKPISLDPIKVLKKTIENRKKIISMFENETNIEKQLSRDKMEYIKDNLKFFEIELIKKEIKVGSLVIKNEINWIANDFDSWGRGIGEGEVLEILEDGDLDVCWPSGICYETINQVILKK